MFWIPNWHVVANQFHWLIALMERHDKLAGWAQFVGALLAVLASWIFARAEGIRATNELHEARERDAATVARHQADEQARLDAIRASTLVLLRQATRKVDQVRTRIELGVRPFLAASAGSHREIARYYERLIALPFHELRDSDAIVILDLLASNFWAVASTLERGTEIPAGTTPAELEEIRKKTLNNLVVATQKVDDALAHLTAAWGLKI